MGARLNKYLSDHHEVFITSRKPLNQFKNVFVGDATDSDFFKKLAECDFDAVVYTVSLNHTESRYDLVKAVNVNVAATANCLQAFSKSSTKRLIYFSTQQAYGPFTAGLDLNENTPCHPQNYYALTHLMSENLCNYYYINSELKSVVVRLSNAVGAPVMPSQHISTLVAHDLCQMCLNEGEMRLNSDGTPQRDFIAMSEVLRGIETLLAAKELKYPLYNLCSGHTITIGELALQISEAFKKMTGKTAKVRRFDGTEILPGKEYHEKRFKLSTTRLAEQGFTPNPSIENALKELLGGI